MNKSNNKLVVTISLFATVLLMTIGFAALSTNLTINGTGTVKSSTWDIHFENLSSSVKVGEANEITPPTLSPTNTTSISGFSVSLRKISDSISYTFDVVNDGSYNAKISSIALDTPICTGNGSNATTDANNVCKYLVYTLTYSDGTAVQKDDRLEKGQSKSMTLKISYGNENVTAQELAKSDVSISNLDIIINYSQI